MGLISKVCGWFAPNVPIPEPPVPAKLRKPKHQKDLYIGQEVIVRSNENEPYMIGIIVDFTLFNGKCSTYVPVVRSKGLTYTCFGIVRPWTLDLEKLLDALDPKEQWNLLAAHYKIDDPRGW